MALAAAALVAMLGGCDLLAPRDQGAAPTAPVAPGVTAPPLGGGPADAATQAAFGQAFSAFGVQEPFWTVEVTDGWVTFIRPGLQPIEGSPERTVTSEGASIRFADAELRLEQRACAGPNGASLPFVARVFYAGEAYQGCARTGAAGSLAQWTDFIPEMLAAIDACIARANARPVQVTFAYQADEEDGVAVRIRDGEGGRYECTARANGSEVTALDALPDSDRLEQEGRVMFLRTGQSMPAAACPAAPLMAPTGEVLGQVVPRSC
jgi:uncharacterized membrane protein